MAVDEKKQPIVIKKVKKGGGAHHGGAWKIAYADFVTAMMAFFLLMWLLGSTSDYDRRAIADLFQSPSAVEAAGGASTSMIDLGGAMEVPKSEGEPLKAPPPDEATEAMEEAARLDELMRRIKEQIENTPTMLDFKDQLKLDITTEGLRIQIVDKENRPMFDLGSAQLKWYTKEILHELAKTFTEVPNHISVTGHTDATRFYGERPNYTNWELSADRANAARRELKFGGLDPKRFGRVVGLASSVLFDKENPAAPVNRRISIIVLNHATERAIGLVAPREEVKLEPLGPDLEARGEPLPQQEESTEPEPAPLLPPPLPDFELTPLSEPAAETAPPPAEAPAATPIELPPTDLEGDLLRALEQPAQ